MTKYEFLKSVLSVCDIMQKNGMKPQDAQYIAMYEDYTRLVAEGHKYVYIRFYLSQEYGIGKTKINELVKMMQEDTLFWKSHIVFYLLFL